MKKILKATKYLKQNGIKKFIKRTKQHLKLLKAREYTISKNGIYLIKNKYKKTIFFKKNNIVYLSKNKLKVTSKNYEIVSKLNMYGYSVHYKYLNEDKEKINYCLPIASNELLEKKHISNLNNKKIVIDNSLKKEDLFLNIKKLNIIKKEKLFESLNKDLQKKFKKQISIIILNYNNGQIIEKCLNSLIKYNDYNYEIIVVDNCSKDGSYKLLEQKYKDKIVLIKNKKNGCSSGRNIGIEKANGKYILFLDSDQYPIYHNWLDNYLEIISNKNCAISWAAGWFKKNGDAGQITDNFLFRYMAPKALYRNDIGYLGSGGLFVKKEILKEIGGFDEKYDPTSYEDTDISLNLRNSGIELIYCPYLGIIHEPHMTTNSGSSEYDNLMKKNAKYFKDKWKKQNKKLLNYIK